MNPWKIGFVGTDGRTLLAALETSRATSELYPGDYRGLVVRGTPAMPAWARRVGKGHWTPPWSCPSPWSSTAWWT